MYQNRCCWIFCLAILFTSTSAIAARVDCLNPAGQPVAWWVLLKLPNTLDDYIYRDATSAACTDTPSCWGPLLHDLNDPERGPLSHTLQQIYKVQNAVPPPSFLMYNDDTSQSTGSETHSAHAHAKGVVATTDQGGFWLVHSVPRFPREQAGKEPYAGLTKNGRNNAQSFLCISLGVEQMKDVASQLVVAHPFIYQKGIFSDELSKMLGSPFEALLKGTEPPKVNNSVKTLVTQNGSVVTSFMKSKHWGKDLYDDFVASELRSNMFVESWNKGRGTLASSCALSQCVDQCALKFDVANVTQIKVDESVAWVNHKDHSKWAVTNESSPTHSVCIGDINRQNGQRVRGGGTVCLADENLWRAFHGMIKEADRCVKPTLPGS